MDLAQLLHRKVELEQARANVANSWQILTGHIAECDYQISVLDPQGSTKVEEPVAEPEALPVE